jgi:hypothetical protein
MAEKEPREVYLVARGDTVVAAHKTESLKGTTGTIVCSVNTEHVSYTLIDAFAKGEPDPKRWRTGVLESGALQVSAWLDSQDRDREEPGSVLTIAPGMWHDITANIEFVDLEDPEEPASDSVQEPFIA